MAKYEVGVLVNLLGYGYHTAYVEADNEDDAIVLARADAESKFLGTDDLDIEWEIDSLEIDHDSIRVEDAGETSESINPNQISFSDECEE